MSEHKMQANSDLLATAAAAPYIKHAESTMNRWRVEGSGPPFIKLGRKVFYRKADLDAWLERHVVSSTSEAGARLAGAK